MRKNNPIYFVITAFLLFVFINPAQATESVTAGPSIDFVTDDKVEAPQAYSLSKPQIENIREREVTVLEDSHKGKYIPPTVSNLSKLYWKKGALSLDNKTHIDNFLLINECAIYQRFFEDDFEWQRVRKAARDMLATQKDSFSNKFKIVMPIDLGRYDMSREGFPLINNTAFLDLRRIEVGGNFANEDICGNNRKIEGYPRNMILVLSKPFNYDFVELDEHIAQAYIIRNKYEPAERPEDLKNQKFNRLAFVRVRFSIDKYHGLAKENSKEPLAIMFGKLEGIDIFEDYKETRLLKSIDLD